MTPDKAECKYRQKLSDLRLHHLTHLRFVNTISNAYQVEEPPQFSGGIIADPMGLGKTLTMIALVATDLDNRRVPREIMAMKSVIPQQRL